MVARVITFHIVVDLFLMAPRRRGKKKPLLPGIGRPLVYAPRERDSDYIGDLFPNALSCGDVASIGYLTNSVAPI